MADVQDDTTGTETGGSLRTKLESALATNASLTETLVSYKAKDVIQAKRLKHVTPEDFKGVKLDEIEAKADELEVAKAADAERVLRSVLASKGLEGDELEAEIAQLLGSDDSKATEKRVQTVSRINGDRPGAAETQGLIGPAKIQAHFAAKARRRK